MTKNQLQKEWKKVIKEIHGAPKCEVPYPKQAVFARELLLFAQVYLSKIKNKENILFNSELYQKIMKEFYR